MGEHPTGLKKPLGLFLDPQKRANKFVFAPLLGVSPSGQFTLVTASLYRFESALTIYGRRLQVGLLLFVGALLVVNLGGDLCIASVKQVSALP